MQNKGWTMLWKQLQQGRKRKKNTTRKSRWGDWKLDEEPGEKPGPQPRGYGEMEGGEKHNWKRNRLNQESTAARFGCAEEDDWDENQPA